MMNPIEMAITDDGRLSLLIERRYWSLVWVFKLNSERSSLNYWDRDFIERFDDNAELKQLVEGGMVHFAHAKTMLYERVRAAAESKKNLTEYSEFGTRRMPLLTVTPVRHEQNKYCVRFCCNGRFIVYVFTLIEMDGDRVIECEEEFLEDLGDLELAKPLFDAIKAFNRLAEYLRVADSEIESEKRSSIKEKYLDQLRERGLHTSHPMGCFRGGVWICKPVSTPGNCIQDYSSGYISIGDEPACPDTDAPMLALYPEGDEWVVEGVESSGGMGPADFIDRWPSAEEALQDIFDFFFGDPERMRKKAERKGKMWVK